jgi:fatty-acyl-CoA synthase
MPPGEPAEARAPSKPERSSTAGWLGALERTSRIGTEPHRILPRVIEELGGVHQGAPALIGARETLSYAELAARANAYARWALEQGLGRGDTVCLLMPNEPDYIAIWLGLSRVGATVALLNTNLVGASLAHCIDIVSPRDVIVAAELLDLFESAGRFLAAQPRIWAHGQSGRPYPRLDPAVSRYDGGALAPAEAPAVTLSDRALCIYTSGTTGLPKAANVSHHRLMMWSHWFAGLMDVRPQDRMYDCLPMYHSIGGVVAPGSVLVAGAAVVVRERFSASQFWSDVATHECTLFQYIGELCRYLLQSPPSPLDTAHRLRLAVGNGLRADVWERFQERFQVPRILEFYAATESTVSLYNVEGKVGAVGRVPPFMAHRSPAAIVKFDVERGEPLRGSDGLCQRAARNEVGELIGRLSEKHARAEHRFEGYTSEAESERKVLRDVFEAGDAWLRTGDLMRMDEAGFFYFVDRVGDTFRWKGENVATTEVARVVGGALGVAEAVVYGVAVPGTEGRAGMAALRVEPGFELAQFRAHLAERLPAYARPVFLRLPASFEITETFKQKRQALVDEGFDPARVADPLFFDDAARGTYVPLDHDLHRHIAEGLVRL